MAKYQVDTEFTWHRRYTIEVDDVLDGQWRDERLRTAAASKAVEDIRDPKNAVTIQATVSGIPYSVGFIRFAGTLNDSEVAALREPKPDHGGDNKITAQSLAEQARVDAAQVMKEGVARAKQDDDDVPHFTAFGAVNYADDELGRAEPTDRGEPQQPEGPSESVGGDTTPSNS